MCRKRRIMDDDDEEEEVCAQNDTIGIAASQS
jgi:hypothetical protein